MSETPHDPAWWAARIPDFTDAAAWEDQRMYLPSDIVFFLTQAMAHAWDEGFEAAERKDNIERGYELAIHALGDAAQRPPLEDLEPRNPYSDAY